MGIKDVFRGGIAASFRKRLADDFSGGSETGLGQSPDGSIWKAIRGQFNINGSGFAQATSNDNTIAAIDMGVKDVEISVVASGGGPGAALWVSDAGNWFSVGIHKQATNCNCTTYYNSWYYTGSCYGGTNSGNCIQYGPNVCVGTWNTATCTAWNAKNCTGYNTSNCKGYYYSKYTGKVCSSYNGSNCKGYNSSTCSKTSSSCNMYGNNCASWNAGNAWYYSCTQYGGENGPYQSCQTCYPQYVRVLQSVGSSVSTVAEWVLTSLVGSFRVKTSNNQIQIDTFQNSDFTSQIDGTLTYTPIGVNVETNFGITVSPSSYDQTYTIDSVEIKRNPS